MWFLNALLDLGLLNSLLVQILDELVTLHPVDERTDISAVPEEGAARQVDGTSCRGGGQRGRMSDVCCFNIWWEGGGVQDKFECWQKCLWTSGKLKATSTAMCYTPRGGYEIKTTHHPQMRFPLANTPGSSAPIMINYWYISAQEKLYFGVEWWMSHLGHSSFISHQWIMLSWSIPARLGGAYSSNNTPSVRSVLYDLFFMLCLVRRVYIYSFLTTFWLSKSQKLQPLFIHQCLRQSLILHKYHLKVFGMPFSQSNQCCSNVQPSNSFIKASTMPLSDLGS